MLPRQSLEALTNVDYTSVDLESPLAMHKEDLTKLSFKDNVFDAILCYHVLEHIEDDKKAISELFRVLKPNGWAILQTPIDEDREHTFEDFTMYIPRRKKKIFWTRRPCKNLWKRLYFKIEEGRLFCKGRYFC